jgi:uncharacterized protein with PIN domain
MVIFVLDASAILRFIDDEAGVETVSQAFQEVAVGQAGAIMSAIHYGEVIGISYRRGGQTRSDRIAIRLASLNIEVLPADATRSAKDAIVHVARRVPYADCFAVELAANLPMARLLTADFDFKPVEHEISIDFLPPKTTNPLVPHP